MFTLSPNSIPQVSSVEITLSGKSDTEVTLIPWAPVTSKLYVGVSVPIPTLCVDSLRNIIGVVPLLKAKSAYPLPVENTLLNSISCVDALLLCFNQALGLLVPSCVKKHKYLSLKLLPVILKS